MPVAPYPDLNENDLILCHTLEHDDRSHIGMCTLDWASAWIKATIIWDHHLEQDLVKQSGSWLGIQVVPDLTPSRGILDSERRDTYTP